MITTGMSFSDFDSCKYNDIIYVNSCFPILSYRLSPYRTIKGKKGKCQWSHTVGKVNNNVLSGGVRFELETSLIESEGKHAWTVNRSNQNATASSQPSFNPIFWVT